MKYRIRGLGALTFAASMCIAFCSTGASAQTPAATSPVAYVYVSSSPSGGHEQIDAYAAAVNGALTVVPGSPFPENGSYLAVENKWLFSTDTVEIYSFSVASDGALKQVSSINAQQFNGYNDGGPVNLFLDRTGTTLYDEDIYGNNGANNTYQFFNVNQASGSLSYLGATASASPEFETPLSFIGNDEYAYGSSCYHGFQNIYGFKRSANGALTDMNLNPPIPAANGGAYCPYLAAADQFNHVAVTLTPTNDIAVIGPTQLAVYSANDSGELTTTSTAQNMPLASPIDMKVSPSGRLLAVGGTNGLQIFYFNGPNPITIYTGSLTTDEIDQISWDDHNHVYAISFPASKLYVFTVTPTSYSQAPGSPYPITDPINIAVLSRTRNE